MKTSASSTKVLIRSSAFSSATAALPFPFRAEARGDFAAGLSPGLISSSPLTVR